MNRAVACRFDRQIRDRASYTYTRTGLDVAVQGIIGDVSEPPVEEADVDGALGPVEVVGERLLPGVLPVELPRDLPPERPRVLDGALVVYHVVLHVLEVVRRCVCIYGRDTYVSKNLDMHATRHFVNPHTYPSRSSPPAGGRSPPPPAPPPTRPPTHKRPTRPSGTAREGKTRGAVRRAKAVVRSESGSRSRSSAAARAGAGGGGGEWGR